VAFPAGPCLSRRWSGEGGSATAMDSTTLPLAPSRRREGEPSALFTATLPADS